MGIDKGLITGSTTMLILKLLEQKDMYGYEMIEELSKQSNDTFSLKAGTLYPILHNLEMEGLVEVYEKDSSSKRIRKYYHITKEGLKTLSVKKEEWNTYFNAVNQVLKGGMTFETI